VGDELDNGPIKALGWLPMKITRLDENDREAWEVLARGYKDFYETPTTDEEYELAWRRLLADEVVHGLGAYLDGHLVGIAHYLFHASVWASTTCYLQDLFTAPEARRGGVARALIEAVAFQAHAKRASRYYWLTRDSNVAARSLYDQVARHVGFIRYDFALANMAG
jgi:GNAT superfamily N-acetyltransferase